MTKQHVLKNSNVGRSSGKDMTEGNPLKLIISFCLPLLAGNLFQQMYNMVDSVVVGQFVGKNALAAVGATGSLNFLAIGSIQGLCVGFCIPISQYFGAKDVARMRKCVSSALRISIFCTIVLTALTTFFAGWMLRAMNTPADIFQGSYDYIIIIFAGLSAMFLYNLTAGILRALGDSKTPLIFLIIASLLNVVLDLLFVVVFHMGVAGAAYATVISQAISGALCGITMWIRFPQLRPSKEERKYDVKITKQLLKIGLPMSLQFSITSIGVIVLQFAVNGFGTDVVAAVTVANRIQFFMFQPMETIGITMATFTGQNLGAGKLDRIRQGVRISLILTIVYGAVIGVLAIFLGRYVALLFIKSTEVAVFPYISRFFLFSGSLFFTLAPLFVFRNTIQGLGYAVHSMFAGFFELLSRSGVALFLVVFLGFDAICIAGPSAWIAADLLLIPVYFYGMNKIEKRLGKEKTKEDEKHTLTTA